MSDEKEEFTLREWIYIGPREGKDTTLAEFQELPGREMRLYKLSNVKKATSPTPGAIYTVSASEGQAELSTLKYQGLWHDENDRAAWQTAARAFNSAETARKRERSETGEDALLDVLKPLRKIYATTNPLNKIAIEIIVIKALRKPLK